jgi:hypothetical protein
LERFLTLFACADIRARTTVLHTTVTTCPLRRVKRPAIRTRRTLRPIHRQIIPPLTLITSLSILAILTPKDLLITRDPLILFPLIISATLPVAPDTIPRPVFGILIGTFCALVGFIGAGVAGCGAEVAFFVEVVPERARLAGLARVDGGALAASVGAKLAL